VVEQLTEEALLAAMVEIRKMFAEQRARKKDLPTKVMAFGEEAMQKAIAMLARE
jgi:hypothetical protein